MLDGVACIYMTEHNGMDTIHLNSTVVSFYDAHETRPKRWRSPGPLAWTSVFAALQFENHVLYWQQQDENS